MTDVPTLRIRLNWNRIEKDSFQKGDHGEVTYYKRVKAECVATQGSTECTFDLRLDIRARILTCESSEDGPILARDVGQACINEMAAFTLMGSQSLFVPMIGEDSDSGRRAEWIVADADHVSGLLHRLKETGPFSARPQPPVPMPLLGPVERIVEAIRSNLEVIHAWTPAIQQKQPYPHHKRIDRATWIAEREIFLKYAEDETLRVEVIRFHDELVEYDAAVRLIVEAAPLGPSRQFTYDVPSDQAGRQALFGQIIIGHLHNEVSQRGLRIVRDFGSDATKKRAKFA